MKEYWELVAQPVEFETDPAKITHYTIGDLIGEGDPPEVLVRVPSEDLKVVFHRGYKGDLGQVYRRPGREKGRGAFLLALEAAEE